MRHRRPNTHWTSKKEKNISKAKQDAERRKHFVQSKENNAGCYSLYMAVNLDDILTDVDKTRSRWNLVLQKDTKNSVAEASNNEFFGNKKNTQSGKHS